MASQVNHFKEFATVADYEAYIQPDDYAKPLVAFVEATGTVMFPQGGGGGGGDCGNPILTSIDVEDYSGGTTFNGLAQITEVEFPAGITAISESAFEKCSSLTSVSIPSGVTSIGNYAFRYCTGLTSINVPTGVIAINTSAFQNCTSLTNVNLPSTFTDAYGGVFQGCSSLTSIDIPSSLTNWPNDFLRETGLTSITIPSTVTNIGVRVFYNCSSLTNVTCLATTPPTLANANAFQGTNANLVIYVPAASVETYKTTSVWSSYASQIQAIPSPAPAYPTDTIYYDANDQVVGTDSSAVLNGPPSGMLTDDVTRIVFGNVVTSIGMEAFDTSIDGSLLEIELGENITSIGEMAFFGEDTITKVTVHATTPPTIGPDVFGSPAYYPAQPFDIYVPAASVSAYQTAWSQFSQFISAIQ